MAPVASGPDAMSRARQAELPDPAGERLAAPPLIKRPISDDQHREDENRRPDIQSAHQPPEFRCRGGRLGLVERESRVDESLGPTEDVEQAGLGVNGGGSKPSE